MTGMGLSTAAANDTAAAANTERRGDRVGDDDGGILFRGGDAVAAWPQAPFRFFGAMTEGMPLHLS